MNEIVTNLEEKYFFYLILFLIISLFLICHLGRSVLRDQFIIWAGPSGPDTFWTLKPKELAGAIVYQMPPEFSTEIPESASQPTDSKLRELVLLLSWSQSS